MRLKIQFRENEDLVLPVNYHYLIQGWIYSMLPQDGYGQFLHNQGYRCGNKMFKLFVFSDLIGNYSVQKKTIRFRGSFYLEIASQSDEFIQYLYRFMTQDRFAALGDQQLEILSIRRSELQYFSGCKTLTIQTISPVVCYRSVGKKIEYFNPEQSEFEEICLQNLKNKAFVNDIDSDFSFRILETFALKKRIVWFKNTFYVGYLCSLKVYVDFPALELIWNTGLSSKNSAGFGMIKIDNY